MQALELKIPPVAISLIFGAVMWAASRMAPVVTIRSGATPFVTVTLLAAGAAVAAAAIYSFRRHNTSVDPTRPEKATSLLITGIFRFTRNPMYLGLALALAGWAVWLGTLLPYLLLPAFIAYMNRYQIGPEERALREKFGPNYDDYVETVRRWL